ncbi:MAG: RNA 2',3'-cyclic phosphodiesterase [Pararhodobacter sp.]
MIRAFLALPLPDPVIAHLALVQQRLRLPRTASRPVPRENFHVTLVFLGAQRPEALEALHEVLEHMHPNGFTLRLNELGVFGGDQPRNLHATLTREPALDALQAKLERAARMIGMKPEKRRFVPHVTLARFRQGEGDPGVLAAAMQATGALDRTPFVAERYGLFRSHLRPDGATYDLLTEYPLAAPLAGPPAPA